MKAAAGKLTLASMSGRSSSETLDTDRFLRFSALPLFDRIRLEMLPSPAVSRNHVFRANMSNTTDGFVISPTSASCWNWTVVCPASTS